MNAKSEKRGSDADVYVFFVNAKFLYSGTFAMMKSTGSVIVTGGVRLRKK